MKNIKQYLINTLNEDSLDDFDIDGKIAQKRNAVSPKEKEKIHKKISKYIDKLYNLCDEFFANKKINLQKTDKYLNSNKYIIYFPDLKWGFTYSPNNNIQFRIVAGQYGRIDNFKNDDCKNLLRELSEYIKQNIKNVNDYVSIWKDSLNGITSASWILDISISVKNLK